MNSLNKLSELGFNDKIMNNFTILEFKKNILRKEVRTISQEFISSISEYKNDKYGRYFIMSFMIRYYPDNIFNEGIFTPIYFLAKSLIITYLKLLNNYNENLEEFKYYLSKYITHYEIWKCKEKTLMINHLLIQYFDITNTLDQTDEELYIKILTNHKNTIFERLKHHGCEEKINKFREGNSEIKDIIINISQEINTGFEYHGSTIEISAKKAFWDNFVELLKNKEQTDSNKIIYDIIVKFKEKLEELVPHRKDLHKYYNEYIDADYIKQLIDNNVFDLKAMDNLIRFSMDQLKELDSAHGSKQIIKWLEDWKLITECYFDIHEVLPYALRDIINKIEKIEYITNLIRDDIKDN